MGKTAVGNRSGLAGYFAIDNQFEFRLRVRKRRDDPATVYIGQRVAEQTSSRSQTRLSQVSPPLFRSNRANSRPRAAGS